MIDLSSSFSTLLSLFWKISSACASLSVPTSASVDLSLVISLLGCIETVVKDVQGVVSTLVSKFNVSGLGSIGLSVCVSVARTVINTVLSFAADVLAKGGEESKCSEISSLISVIKSVLSELESVVSSIAEHGV